MATNHPSHLIYLDATNFVLLDVFLYIHFFVETSYCLKLLPKIALSAVLVTISVAQN